MTSGRFTAACAILIALAGSAQAQSPLGDTLPEMAAVDTDKDGQITLEEFKAWRAANWSRIDRNGDGMLSADDLPLFARARWNTETARQRRAAADTNGDGVITRDEALAAPPYAFLRLDTDGNGALSAKELAAASQAGN